MVLGRGVLATAATEVQLLDIMRFSDTFPTYDEQFTGPACLEIESDE